MRGTEVRLWPERGLTEARDRERERYIKRSDQKIFAQTIFFYYSKRELAKGYQQNAVIQMGYIHYMDTLYIYIYVYSIY